MWYTSSSGKIELEMTLDQARGASHQGRCDEDVAALIPELQAQLDKIAPGDLADELREYGAWDAEELADHDANITRLVWIAAGDIVEDAQRTYHDCGICGHYHPIAWDDDCRDDANRFTADQLDEKHGASEWLEVDMPV